MIILASTSPRRKELLKLIVPTFKVETHKTDETLSPDLSPIQAVKELAFRKGEVVARKHPKEVVISADTLVSLENKLLGKPRDEQDAYSMLSALSGQFHQVYTGVSIQQGAHVDTFYRHAHVQFATMADWEIWQYIDSKEPMDKAGAYGIQGKGACFIKGIQGDFFCVMGLPVQGVYQSLKNFTY